MLVLVEKLYPTQDSFGSLSIGYKVDHIENAWNNGNFEEYLDKKIVPSILGPKNKIYILDRHHTAIAISKANIPKNKKQLKIEVIHDWSHLTIEEFEQKMVSSHFLWIDENSTFKTLPKRLKDLADNPYRSLAWKVRKMGGFKKVKKPFLEFYWSDFFKHNGIKLTSSKESEILKVLPEAMSLASSTKAKNNPGYIGL